MMKHRIRFARITAKLLYDYVFVMMLTVFLRIIFKSGIPAPLEYLFVFACFIFSYVVREWVNPIALIPLLHIIVGAVVWFMPFDVSMKAILTAMLIYLMISSVSYAGSGSEIKPVSEVPWPTMLACFIIFIFGRTINDPVIMFAAYLAPAILLILYFVILYIDGLREYMNMTKDVAGLPLSRMIHVNTVIVSFIVFLLILSLYLVGNVDAGGLWDTICKGIAAIGRIIIQIIKIIAIFLEKLFPGYHGDTTYEVAKAQEEISDASYYAYNVLELLLKVILIIFAVYLVYKLAGYIIRKLSAKRYNAFDLTEEAERLPQKRTERRKEGRTVRIGTMEERARQYYRMRILRYHGSIELDAYKTSQDIRQQINGQMLSDVTEITSVYNDIRYGGIKTDKTILNRMKKLSREK